MNKYRERYDINDTYIPDPGHGKGGGGGEKERKLAVYDDVDVHELTKEQRQLQAIRMQSTGGVGSVVVNRARAEK